MKCNLVLSEMVHLKRIVNGFIHWAIEMKIRASQLVNYCITYFIVFGAAEVLWYYWYPMAEYSNNFSGLATSIWSGSDIPFNRLWGAISIPDSQLIL